MKMKLIENPNFDKLAEFVFNNKYLCLHPKEGGKYNVFYFSNTEYKEPNEIVLDNYRIGTNSKTLEKERLVKYGYRWPLKGITIPMYNFYEISPFNNKIIEFLKHD